jgi:hypothetical protein
MSTAASGSRPRSVSVTSDLTKRLADRNAGTAPREAHKPISVIEHESPAEQAIIHHMAGTEAVKTQLSTATCSKGS